MQGKETAHSVADRAVEYGVRGCSCSEAVALALAPMVGHDPEWVLRAASPFAGGMGLAGQTCGAVAAAMMLLGLRHGPDSATDAAGRRQAMLLASAFADSFTEAKGSTLCSELCQGHTLTTPEGARALRASGIPEQLIRCAVELAAPLLEAE